MWNEPADRLIGAVREADTLADFVETHLDTWPLPVDEAEVEALTSRVRARMAPRPRRWRAVAMWTVLGGLAAGALLTTWPATVRDMEQPPPLQGLSPVQVPVLVETVMPTQAVDRLPLQLAEGAEVLLSARAGSVVALVADGEVVAGDQVVPAGHWVLVTRTSDGSAPVVVFPDGTAPPELDQDTWAGRDVEEQLHELRWLSVPDSSRETLRRLLEEP